MESNEERRNRQHKDSAEIVFIAIVIISVLSIAFGIVKIF